LTIAEIARWIDQSVASFHPTEPPDSQQKVAQTRHTALLLQENKSPDIMITNEDHNQNESLCTHRVALACLPSSRIV
jgi:hypothetical protein